MSADLGLYMLAAIIAMAVCMAIVPVLIKYAAVLGMLDSPDERKVHVMAIPRVGGIGIVIGLMLPLVIWLPMDLFVGSFLFGCLILLLFGAWDDAKELGPYIKFFGQFLASISVVYFGDVYVHHFPLLGSSELPAYIGKPFTVIAIVGVINAVNLSDGLDGLAGGEALLSLLAIAFLSYLFNGDTSFLIAASTIGGIFGFLRFNSHPAKVFMGDSGSQTLGFILAVLVVHLTQQVNAVVSPVVALLLLGLPVIDSFAVFYMRAKRGDSLVVAAKDHLHHRLLDLGFYHYESVIIIYSIQVLLVVSAVSLPYESDIFLLGLFFGICSLIFIVVTFTENSTWRAHVNKGSAPVFLSNILARYEYLLVVPYRVLISGISLFIVAAAITSSNIPFDLGVSSLVLLILLLAVVSITWFGKYFYRLVMYTTIGFAVYLLSSYPPGWLLDQISLIYIFFFTMTFAAFITVRIKADQFQITPLDYLVVIMVIVVSMVPGIEHGATSMIWMVVQIVILFYACELVIQNVGSRLNSFTGAAGLSLALIAFRGLV